MNETRSTDDVAADQPADPGPSPAADPTAVDRAEPATVTAAGAGRTGALERAGRWLLMAAVLAHLLAFLYVVAHRLNYPFELEWMEGAMVDHTARLLRGEDLYTEPGIHHVSFLYTPLYYYASAVVAWFTGIGFLPLRLVAVLASLGCAVLTALLVRRESGSLFAGIVGGGVFVAGFWLVDGWHDLARNDNLYLLLVLAAAACLRYARDDDRLTAVAGGVMVLAILTKQTALVILPALLVGTAILSWRRAAVFAGVTTTALGIALLLYSWGTDGWFLYFTFEVPRSHALVEGGAFWTADMLRLWPTLLVAIVWLVSGVRGGRAADTLFWACLGGGLLAASWITRHHPGGHINALLPWLLGGGLILGLAMSPLACCGIVRGIAMVGALAQFGLLAGNPADFLPKAAHRKAWVECSDYLRGFEGEVFLPFHGHVLESLGKRASLHGMALHDVLGHASDGRRKLADALAKALADKTFKVIVVDEPRADVLLGPGRNTPPGYRRIAELPFDAAAMVPLHGMRAIPTFLFQRIE